MRTIQMLLKAESLVDRFVRSWREGLSSTGIGSEPVGLFSEQWRVVRPKVVADSLRRCRAFY